MPKSNIFMSREFKQPKPEENKGRRALVLIQGTGAVRAGIWARSVCINENLELGSMLPLVDLCRDLNIPVLVMNPNLNSDPETGVSVPYSGSMTEHACYVWDTYVKDSGFDQISVIAHSAGGGCLTEIQKAFEDSFYSQVVKIAYTDSWTISPGDLSPQQRQWMFKNAVHYEASREKLGAILSMDAEMFVCPRVSAGHDRHEFTTGTSQYLIMNQFGYEKPLDYFEPEGAPE